MSEPEAIDLEKVLKKKGQRGGRNNKPSFKKGFNRQQRPPIQRSYRQRIPKQRFNRQNQWNHQSQRQPPRYQRRQERQQSSRKPIMRTGVRRQREQQQQKPITSTLQPNVILKGLDISIINDSQLRELCQVFGPLDMCKLDRDDFGNVKPEGIGLIRFERAEDAKQCVERLNGTILITQDDGRDTKQGGIIAKLADQNQQGVLQIKKQISKSRQRRQN